MINKKKVVIFTAAGFSVPAGLPSGEDLSKLILNPLKYPLKNFINDLEFSYEFMKKRGVDNKFIKDFLLKKLHEINDYANSIYNYLGFNSDQDYIDLIIKNSNEIRKQNINDYESLIEFYKPKILKNKLKNKKLKISTYLKGNNKEYFPTSPYEEENYPIYIKLVLFIHEIFNKYEVENTKYLDELKNIFENDSLEITFITTNQDLILNKWFEENDITYEECLWNDECVLQKGENEETLYKYQLFEKDKTVNSNVNYLKIHGSIDWHERWTGTRNINVDQIKILDNDNITGLLKPKRPGGTWGSVENLFPMILFGNKKYETKHHPVYSSLLNKAKEKIKEADYLAVIGCGFTKPDKHITKPLLDYFNKAKENGKKGMIIDKGNPKKIITDNGLNKIYKGEGTEKHLKEMVREILDLAKDS